MTAETRVDSMKGRKPMMTYRKWRLLIDRRWGWDVHCLKMASAHESSAQRNKGFTLVLTLSLLILLSIIVMGMLSMSAVSLRNSAQQTAMMEAKANARMALMMALGELQKSVGPDRAVTATSEILSTAVPTKPRMTGAWESWWDFDPSAAPDYSGEKPRRFKKWFVSSANPADVSSMDFVASPWNERVIELIGQQGMGGTLNEGDRVLAGVVPLSEDGLVKGGYAWHVADESVKARVNLNRDPRRNTTLAEKRALVGGHRPNPSVMIGADGLPVNCFPSDFTPAEYLQAVNVNSKIPSIEQTELLDTVKGRMKSLRHEITTHSLGVMADVRGGGLKQDLSSICEMAANGSAPLPVEFNGRNLYASTHGITGVSDPKWSAIVDYYNSFRNLSSPDTNPTYAIKPGSVSTAPVPDGFTPAPVIAKVDTIFSIVARPFNTNQAFWMHNDTKNVYEYCVNLIFTPVVTLHNPYNVNVSFRQMQVTFSNIPVAFQYWFQNNGTGPFVSNSVRSGNFEALNTMSLRANRGNRNFTINIADWANDNSLTTSTTINGSIVMKPGQTLVCSPTMPPTSSYDQDTRSGSNTSGFDWENTLITRVKARPRFTPGLGFEIYAVTISPMNWRFITPARTDRISYPTTPGAWFFPGGWAGHPFFMLRDASSPYRVSTHSITDRFYVETKIQRPEWYISYDNGNNSRNMRCVPATMSVTARLQATASDALVDYANLQFEYGDANNLDYTETTKPTAFNTSNSNLHNVLNDRVYRYPPTGSLTGTDVAAPPAVRYNSQANYVHPIAIFSAYSRTTNGGVFETGLRTPQAVNSPQVNLLKDGRLAGKPFLFHNPSRPSFSINLATEKPAVQPYEINFQPFLSRGDYQDYMDVDASHRVPSLSGNKTTSGIKSGSYLEIPSGPLQTIADLRRSNALSTAYAPHFVQPTSNSLAHPLMPTDRVWEDDPSMVSYRMLDHSVLANHALYDRFYFSTFATRGNRNPADVFEDFMMGASPLASQSFQPYLPSGETVTSAKAAMFSGGIPNPEGYAKAASYQMIRGPFNVNSTSVQAWKAVLAAMKKSDLAILWARNGMLEIKPSNATPVVAMSLHNGGALDDADLDAANIDNARTNQWNGFRELSDAELQRLAEKIVEEVRARGPFLSMSEFVNRQVGPANERSMMGALEAAIAKAEINEQNGVMFPATFLNQVPIAPADINDTRLYNYQTPAATLGNPAAGAPGWVSQGDLLKILEPAATVRGDTFVVRTYGESLDKGGRVMAKAYAEAILQRVPDYVDAVDKPSEPVAANGSASTVNRLFGRRFEVVSFRWLTVDEI